MMFIERFQIYLILKTHVKTLSWGGIKSLCIVTSHPTIFLCKFVQLLGMVQVYIIDINMSYLWSAVLQQPYLD